jgi:flagellar protein FlaG
MQVGGINNVVALPVPASDTPDRGASGVAAKGSDAPAKSSPSPAQLQAAIMAANRALQVMNRELEFELDPQSGRLVTRLIDTSDNEVLRQIPSEDMLRIARALDRIQGLLFEQQA